MIGATDGHANAATFTATFFYIDTQLQVTATSPPVGSVFTFPGDIDLVVQFNEAFNPSPITTSDFEVSQGSSSSAVPLTPQSVDLTITGVTQDGIAHPDDSDRRDSRHVPAFRASALPAHYVTDIVSEPYPTPLAGQAPGGQPDLRPLCHRHGGFCRRHGYVHTDPGRRPELSRWS